MQVVGAESEVLSVGSNGGRKQGQSIATGRFIAAGCECGVYVARDVYLKLSTRHKSDASDLRSTCTSTWGSSLHHSGVAVAVTACGLVRGATLGGIGAGLHWRLLRK